MLQFFKNLGFQKKILTVCLCISLIPFTILGIFSYRQIRTLLFEREKTALKDTLTQESKSLHHKFKDVKEIVFYISWNETLKNAMNQTYDKKFDTYLLCRDIISPLFTTITYTDSNIDSIILYTDVKISPRESMLQPLTDIQESSWYPEVSNSYSPIWIFSPEEKILSVANRFYDIKNGHTVIVKIDLNYDSFFSSLTTLFDDPYGILLTDANDSLVYQHQTDNMSEQTSDNFVLEESTIAFNNWKLILYRPIDIVLAPANAILPVFFILLSICLCCVFLASYFLSHVLVHPLKKLEENMQEVKKGKFTVTMEYNSTDEIGELVHNFRNMVNQLNHLVNETLKAKIRHQSLEMRALQAQIKPHFLYNALSLINSRAILNNQTEIEQITQYLSTFYRTTLNKGKNIIPVKNELDNVYAYINIQLLMHSDSFEVLYHMTDELQSFKMINLLLQPLVENAIIHGIDRRHEPGGRLEIRGFLAENSIIFQIEDNGPGMDAEQLSKILTLDSTGYGVKNVNSRIQLFYGKEFELQYESCVGKGTTVTLTIPTHCPENELLEEL